MGYSYPSFFCWMFELTMAALLMTFHPTITLNYFYDFCAFRTYNYTHNTHEFKYKKQTSQTDLGYVQRGSLERLFSFNNSFINSGWFYLNSSIERYPNSSSVSVADAT